MAESDAESPLTYARQSTLNSALVTSSDIVHTETVTGITEFSAYNP